MIKLVVKNINIEEILLSGSCFRCIKEEDGSKSAYLAHIGGFFAFVGFAGLSLIFWIIKESELIEII